MKTARFTILALAATTLIAACSRETARPGESTPAAKAAPATRDWPAFSAAFIESRFEADPSFAVQSGRHEFDGRMPDWSRPAIEADVARLRAHLGALQEFDPASLTDAQRFEREYTRWVIEYEIFWRASAEQPFRNPAWYLERLDPSMYLTREYAPLPQRLQGFLGYARAIPALTAAIRANLRTPLPRPFIERGTAGFGGYAKFFREEMPALFAQLDDANQKRELEQATVAAAEAMDALARWLESQRATATDDFALGAAKFSEMLRTTERLDMPIKQLEAVGRDDLQRNLKALEQACASFAHGAKLSSCVAKMRARKPDGGTVEGARRQLDELRQFVLDKKLVSIPKQEQALVAESPPYNRGNFAYISIPGPMKTRL